MYPRYCRQNSNIDIIWCKPRPVNIVQGKPGDLIRSEYIVSSDRLDNTCQAHNKSSRRMQVRCQLFELTQCILSAIMADPPFFVLHLAARFYWLGCLLIRTSSWLHHLGTMMEGNLLTAESSRMAKFIFRTSRKKHFIAFGFC